MKNNFDFDMLRDLTIGSVEFVSPTEIKVILDINAPKNTALNEGYPSLFPKVNGFVLIPNEAGALVGMISWMGVEYSEYPKRKGFNDFDLVDLPFPLRKISLNPLGIMVKHNGKYQVKRGVYNYPSVGDSVILPSHEQLQAIVENQDKKACVKIGVSPLAADAPVYVNPDKLFGRHLAVLGNTGSGKSCSVAGLIRWSLESAKEYIENDDKKLNARFIVLDPNGEYTNTFDDVATDVRKYQVNIDDNDISADQLQVPVWLWNSYEWSSITKAKGGTQRPLLRRALRELRNGEYEEQVDEIFQVKRYLVSLLISLTNKLKKGPSFYADFPGKQNCGEFLKTTKEDLIELGNRLEDGEEKDALVLIIEKVKEILELRSPNRGYYPAFCLNDLDGIIHCIKENQDVFGQLQEYIGPNEDSPVYFAGENLPDHLDRLAQEQGVQQYLDFLIMRIRTMLSDTRMSSVIGTDNDVNLLSWLEKYIGDNDSGEIVVIDLSIVPSDIVDIIVSVITRIVFESLQRYRKKYGEVLPTVLVMEEAHNFISRYNRDNDELSPGRLCSSTFEKVSKEGRKFGLGLILSSQRPSELSSTVLSQCNTFLLHRIVNDRDQELVKKLLPDNLGNIFCELPILPTRKAILLGWAAPIPVLVNMNELKEEHRPQSDDPDFWDVWTYKKPRNVDWSHVVSEWVSEE